MDSGGIRKRKDAKDNKINIRAPNNIYNNNAVINDNNLNVSNFPKGNNPNWKYNENVGGGMPPNLERKASDGNFKFGKKKSMKLFNSSNISALSTNCIKSLSNLVSNINNSNNSVGFNGSNNMNGKGLSRFSLNDAFHNKQTGSGQFSKGISYLSNMTNVKGFFGNDNNNKGKDDFNFFRNYENNVYNNRTRHSEGTNTYSNSNNNPNGNDAANKNNISTYSNNGSKVSNANSINSSNLENILNNKEVINEKYQIKGFGNNYMSEINNLRNITSDETYYTCLDNLLRNHGNIDSNEMLKYNDKNINCLNDIIFLDIYRAYNVLTYMQEKVNIIIYTIKIIGKKLKKKHVPEEVVISLEFLNFCVKNLGLFFIRFIDESLMKKISSLLKTTTLKKSITKNVKSKLSKFLIVPIIHPGVATDPRLHFIKRKILFMLQLWHDSFILYQHVATTFFMEYRNLKEKGITFPIVKKSEKFFVKNAENSPSFSDDNILHELPLNLSQINNIIKVLKEIKNMDNNDNEKYKCIDVISKYTDPILLSINKLSDYKGNINISVTLNSLLYINDQICIFEKMKAEREKEMDLQKDKEQMNDSRKSREKDKNRKEKRKKKKNTLPNIDEIIFNKFDPWNTENISTNDKPGIDNNGMIGTNDELFFSNNGFVDSFNKLSSAENVLGSRSSNTINNISMSNLNSNENVFSFFSDEKPINEPTQTNQNNEIDDIYSVFNELKFNDEKEQDTFNNNNKTASSYMPQPRQDNFIHNNVLNRQELQPVANKNMPTIIGNTMNENNANEKKIDKKASILEDQLHYLFTNKNALQKQTSQTSQTSQTNQNNQNNFNNAEITNSNMGMLDIDNIVQNDWNNSINIEKDHIFHNDIPERVKSSESISKSVSKNSISIDDIDNDVINTGKSNLSYDIDDKIYENLNFSRKNSEQSKDKKNNNMGFIPDKEKEIAINNIQEEKGSNNNNKNYDEVFESFDFNLNDNKVPYPNASDKNIHIMDNVSKTNVNCTEENENVLKADKKDKINTKKNSTSFSDEHNDKNNNIHNDDNDTNLNYHKNRQNSKTDQDSDDINIDDIDEITKAIDDLNYNFENMNIYKYDN
ncbi:TOM1-like protein, putative [Plasmodium chabaudi chabaudi]|uniref:TOM1-like protein, putative n=1 Tax=Plasmodium chabaudi chabaudi TaxID=31271 RepID=A0A4V0KCR3_PLACU|nr:TOM1-like protein, putative [Plasmodium chabaudi chabaudi]VTZ70757.1 TOM1-like protein, putative [Plasmodium chabaudi chabaudi]|eukprot:XP_016654830.1 conserved Plasmodium protein, unknown function [Plasmodium chabaudi chabaudi]